MLAQPGLSPGAIPHAPKKSTRARARVNPKHGKKRAIVYLRVSTFGQEKNGKNLEGQLDEARAYCQRKGYTLDDERDVYRDIISGARTDRVGYYRLLSRLEKEDADVVVAWNVSRLGRNSLDSAWLMVKAKEHGFGIETAQEGMDFAADPTSELVYDILSAAAKFQRNTILQDMLRGKKTGHKNGRWVSGTAPLGYSTTGPRGARQLTPNADAGLVREIFTAYAAGESTPRIAKRFNHEGRRAQHGTHGGTWNNVHIGKILACPIYRGLVQFQGDVAQGLHDAIITPDLWDAVQQRRAQQARYRTPRRPGDRS